MKLLRNIALLFLYPLCLANDYPKDDGCRSSDLKGKIRTLTEISFYEFHDCEFHTSYRTDKSVYVFDQSGNLQEHSKYGCYNSEPKEKLDFSDTPASREVYLYQDGKIVEKEVYHHGRLFAVEKHTSDGNKQIETKTLKHDADENSVEEFYDVEGRIIESRYVRYSAMTNTAKLFNQQKYFYDDRGNLVRRQRYDEELDGFYDFYAGEFDKYGNELQATLYSIDGEVTMVRKYAYRNGLLVTIIIEDKKDEMRGEFSKGIPEKYWKVSDTLNYTYENFDAKGNWLKRTLTGNKLVPAVTTRTIEYY
ncbi:MAG: hypothetical protein JNL72_10000 [Flavipsychrobacter sp.]|nr:hypothetical protein [Flavipsychrobacter sp.]